MKRVGVPVYATSRKNKMSKNPNLSGNLFNGQPLKQNETSLSATIADYLDRAGIYHERINSGMARGPKGGWIHLARAGTPDRFLCLNGRFVALEVKVPGQQPTQEQCAIHERIRQSGGIVVVVESLNQVVALVKELKNLGEN